MPSGELAPEALEDKIDLPSHAGPTWRARAETDAGLSWNGLARFGGRLQGEDIRDMADLADMYVDRGEIRLTVEQNFIIPCAPRGEGGAALAEPLLALSTVRAGSRWPAFAFVTAGAVLGFAQIETKKSAYATFFEHLESVLDPNGDLRMIWTFSPSTCTPCRWRTSASPWACRFQFSRSTILSLRGQP